MQNISSTDIVIIGGGPVGLFAVFQAGMLGMKSHLFDTLDILGGQCAALYPKKPIYDIPAHPNIDAIDLVNNLIEQAKPFEPVYHNSDQVLEIQEHGKEWKITTKSGFEIISKIVLIAAGNGAFVPNHPLLPGIEEFEKHGSILYSVKDYDQFIDKNVLIAGGGDSAIDWTNILANFAKKVFLVHRRDKFRCSPDSLSQAKKLEELGKVEFVTPYQIEQIKGVKGIVNSVIVRNLEHQEKEVYADKILFCYGLKMSLGPIESWNLNLHNNRIVVDPSTFQTNLQGVYAVGDIATYPRKLKLILVGFSEVAYALHHAYDKVFSGAHLHFEYSTSKGLPR